jgi:hypothetical protein
MRESSRVKYTHHQIELAMLCRLLRLSLLTFGAASIGFSMQPLLAEQQVALKSGPVLVGEVEFVGDAVVVHIDGAKHRVPFSDIASVSPVAFGRNQQATRLLIAAFEARLLNDSSREAVGLLAEASRLAPDDPQIAFWRASTLVDAGSGNAAHRVLEAHRASIEDAFPDAVADLAKRINRRMMLELLPTELVERIDQLNARAAAQPADGEMQAMYSAFRVIDQFNDPVPRTALQVQGNINDQRIEEFDDGYFLVTFNRHRNMSDDFCRLSIAQYGIKASTHELRAAANYMYPAQEFVAQRYDEADKRLVAVKVVDRRDQPISGARVQLQPSSRGGPQPEVEGLAAVADDGGRATLQAFPGVFGLTAVANGFNYANMQVELNEGVDVPERRIILHREISAEIRVVWTSSPLQPGGGVSSGEATISVAGQRRSSPVNNQELMWLRPTQIGDRLTLQMNLMMYGPTMAMGGGSWVRKRPVDKADDESDRLQDAKELFESIDLEKADDLDDQFKVVSQAGDGPNFGSNVINASADFGDVFVGKIPGRDMRTGRPALVTFKALIEHAKGGVPEGQ